MVKEDDNVDEPMNESLMADEIRRDLPEPIMQQTGTHEVVHDEHTEIEEKAMEIKNEQQTEITNTVNDSIKIPMHSYDMDLIPEYDPTKYMEASMEDVDSEQEEEEHEIKRTKEHYSSSYLDTYSTLIDIPQIMGNDQHYNSERKQSNIYHGNDEEDDDENENEEDTEQTPEDEGSDDNEKEKEEEEEKGNNDNVQNAIKAIMDRLENMEKRMDEQFQTMGARLTILEGKIKFVESQQKTQPSTSTMSSSESKGQSKPRSITSSMSEQKEFDNDQFVSSTIGSSSLPISLTPAPRTNNMENGFNMNMSKTVPRTHRSNVMVDNRYVSSTTQRPKHIHALTARSPFIGSSNTNTMSLQPFGGTMFGATAANLYGVNPHVDVMRYPLSSSTENKSNTSNGIQSRSVVPRIQSVGLPSDDQNSSNDPDNTLNFINELKEMLKSTDQLLKSKPMSLYDANI